MESSGKISSSKKTTVQTEDLTKFTPAQRKAIIAKVMKSSHGWAQKKAILNTLGIKPVRRRYEITFTVNIEEGLLVKKTMPQATQRRLLSFILNPGDPYGYQMNTPSDATISLTSIKEIGVVPPTKKKATPTASKATRVTKKAPRKAVARKRVS